MLVVVLDTSTPAVTAGLARVGTEAVEMLSQQRLVDGRAHGELLGPAIKTVLADAPATPRQLGALVAGLGPGPFTGLRVGLVTAAAMGHALGIPTYGVCSLDGLGALTTATTLVATDARRREVYWAVYDKGERVTDPAVNRPAEIVAILHERDMSPVAAVGDGAHRYAAELAGWGRLILHMPEEPRSPSPTALAGLAAHRIRTGATGEVLTPLYLRRPDAVEPGARKPVTR